MRGLFLDEEYINRKVTADINLAKEEFDSAKILFEVGKYRQTVTHSYYAMFNAATALLTKKDIVANSHEGLIMFVGKEYVKNGIFDKEIFGFLTKTRVDRKDSSYDSLAIFTEEDAFESLNNSEIFIQEVEKLL